VAPLIAVALGLILTFGAFAAKVVQAQSLAATTARQLSRGTPEAQAASILERSDFELNTVNRESGLVCAHLKSRSRTQSVPLGTTAGVFSLIPLEITGRACAAIDPA
jgi:hypothetical protein